MANKKITLSRLKSRDPDIILLTHKTQFLQPQLQNYLNAFMVPIGNGIWAKGKEFSPVKTKQFFRSTKSISGESYWIIPEQDRPFVYSAKENRLINEEVLLLNKNYHVSKEEIKYLAIPKKYLILGLSSISPLQFPAPPYNLFRFDTGF